MDQALTWVNPLRYYAEPSRANLMKAAGFADVWPQLGALAVFGAVIFGAATLRFRERLA